MYIANTAPVKARGRTFALVSKEQCPCLLIQIQTVPVISEEMEAGVQEAINEVNVSTLAHRS